jgi:hypothetical protein
MVWRSTVTLEIIVTLVTSASPGMKRLTNFPNFATILLNFFNFIHIIFYFIFTGFRLVLLIASE